MAWSDFLQHDLRHYGTFPGSWQSHDLVLVNFLSPGHPQILSPMLVFQTLLVFFQPLCFMDKACQFIYMVIFHQITYLNFVSLKMSDSGVHESRTISHKVLGRFICFLTQGTQWRLHLSHFVSMFCQVSMSCQDLYNLTCSTLCSLYKIIRNTGNTKAPSLAHML